MSQSPLGFVSESSTGRQIQSKMPGESELKCLWWSECFYLPQNYVLNLNCQCNGIRSGTVVMCIFKIKFSEKSLISFHHVRERQKDAIHEPQSDQYQNFIFLGHRIPIIQSYEKLISVVCKSLLLLWQHR